VFAEFAFVIVNHYNFVVFGGYLFSARAAVMNESDTAFAASRLLARSTTSAPTGTAQLITGTLISCVYFSVFGRNW
jgi:hypothetical protein